LTGRLVDPLIGCLLIDWVTARLQIQGVERGGDVNKPRNRYECGKRMSWPIFKMLPLLQLFVNQGLPQTTPDRLVCNWSKSNRVPQYHYTKLLEVTYILSLSMHLITGWVYVPTKLSYFSGQCNVSGERPLAPSSHYRGPGLIQGHSNMGLCWWHWDKFPFRYLGFPRQ